MNQPEIIKALYSKLNSSLRVSMPAIIETYDFKQQKASIKINIKELFSDGSSIEYPVINNVPIIFPASGGGSLTMPVKRGDGCLVVFADRDIKNWLLGVNNARPSSRRQHHMSDAIAIIGLSSFNKISKAKNNTDILLNYDGSDVRLKPSGIVEIESAKEVNIKSETIVINCKSANIKAEESIKAECKTLNVVASESCQITSKSAILKIEQEANITCNTAKLVVEETATIECNNAFLKAANNINTESHTFTQKGNLVVEGNVEITGSSKFKGDATCSGTLEGQSVKTSGGIDLATHKHIYNEAQQGSNPTVVYQGITEEARSNV